MITFYTCTQVTSEIYDAYLRYNPIDRAHSFEEVQAAVLCNKHGGIIIYPVCPDLNARHLREFGSTDPQSIDGDSNILVSTEEFFRLLFIYELDQ